jgi:hypothetical protein
MVAGLRGPAGPFTAERLRELAAAGESTQVEFKSAWYDLGTKAGKAKFIRGMLAHGNAVTPADPGLFIVGVNDPKDGVSVRGVTDSPTVEALMQLVASFTSPPVRFAVHHVPLNGGQAVDVLEVLYELARPHWAIRELPDLRCDVAYVRRGPTIGTLSGPELEAMIRQKDRHPHQVATGPIQAAFISHENWYCGGKVIARITNRSAEPVKGISAAFDIVMQRVQGAQDRRATLIDATLQPGESRDVELDLYTLPVIHDGQRLSPHGNLRNRAADLTLHVEYRDTAGELRSVRETLVLSD